jgi:hypothetical protein
MNSPAKTPLLPSVFRGDSIGHRLLDEDAALAAAPPPRVRVVQAQLDQVKDIMIDNISKAIDRDANLGELERKSEDLEAHANVFTRASKRLKNKFWWKNIKLTIALVVTLLAIVLVIVLVALARR